jgi:hypothetical protein
MFSLIYGIDLLKMQEYYEKQVRLSGAHVQESEEGEYS